MAEAQADPEILAEIREPRWRDARWSRELEPQILDAAARVLKVGAQPPLDWKGVGAYGVVFCDARGLGYKAARWGELGFNKDSLEREAQWLRVASAVPELRRNVAAFRRYYPREVVIERECIQASPHIRFRRPTKTAQDIHDRLAAVMAGQGFGMPEFKEDSYVFQSGRGWVLVDASSPVLKGKRLVAQALQTLQGKRFYRESPADIAWALRMEAGSTIDPDRARRLSDRLLAMPDANVTPLASSHWASAASIAEEAEERSTRRTRGSSLGFLERELIFGLGGVVLGASGRLDTWISHRPLGERATPTRLAIAGLAGTAVVASWLKKRRIAQASAALAVGLSVGAFGRAVAAAKAA
jgi:hypothetical protein